MHKRLSIQTTSWFLISVFLFLVAGILITGYFFYQKQQERIKLEAQNYLIAIADLKMNQIGQWRRERIADGELIRHNVPLLRAFETFLKTSVGANRKQELLTVMESYRVKVGYESSVLFDAKGKVRLAVSRDGDSVGAQAQSLFQEVLRRRKVILSDLHKSGPFPLAHMDLMVPLFSPDRHDSALIGVFMLRIDPEIFLFPLIETWPTSSLTSETILFEQDGDSIVYLSELRHRKNTTLTLRLPISDEQLPASMAVRGIKRVVEGVDYRGVPVLAAIRPIPDSPWYMNAKVDQEEIYAPLRSQIWIVNIGMLLLILSAGSIIGLWWRNQRTIFFRKQYEAELDRKAIVTHFDHIIKYANDIIMLTNMDGRIVEVNDQACRTYGYTRDEMFQLNIRDIRTPESISQSEMQMKQVEKQNGMVFESEHRRKDGTVFPVEDSSRFIKIEGVRFYQSIIRDITERKRIEQAMQENEDRFRRIFEEGPFGTVITGLDFHFTKANTAFCKMMGYSEHEITSLTFRDITHPEDISNSAEAMRKLFNGEIPVYRTEKRYVRKDTKIVWGSLTVTLVRNENGQFLYYLAMVEDITERKIAEDALLQSEERYRQLFELSPDPIFIQSEGNIEFINSAGIRLFGAKSAEELIGRQVVDLMHPDYREIVAERIKHVKELQSPVPMIEEKYLRLDGSSVDVEVGASPFLYKGKSAAQVVVRDITERKRAEESLRESEERFRRLVGSVTDYIYSVKLESGRLVSTTHAPACVSVTGYTAEEYAADPDLWYRMIYKEDKQIVTNLTEKILSGFDVLPLEHRIVHKNGSLRWVKNTPVLKRNAKGVPIAYDGLIEDITMQKQADEVLRESEETAHALLNAPSDAAYLLDIDRRIIAVNEAEAKRFGKGIGELIGVCVDDLFPPEIVKSRRAVIDQVLRICKPVHFEDELFGMHLENALYPITDAQGKVTRIAVFSRDITERIQTEEARRQSESLFKMLVESSPVAIAVFSGPSKKLEYVSDRFAQLFGYDKEDVPSMDAWWQLAYPVEEYRNQIEIKWCETLVEAQREGSVVEPLESVVTCQDGSTKYIESSFTSIGEDTLVFFTDLTQNRLAQEALRQTLAFNELLIQTMPFGMNIVDEEGNILFVSKAMKEMLAVDVVDMCCWKVYKDDNQQCVDCPLRKGITFGKPDVIETTGILGGKIFQISQVGMMYEGKKAMLEVFQDITEQKKLQQELIQSQKLLSIGTMAGGIAHDFNNILAIILGYSSILHSIKDNPEKFSNGVTAIRQAVDRGAGLVRQILTFARKTDISFEPLSISELVKELVSMLEQTFPKIITFNTSIEKHLPYIKADQTQIHQALLNLCVNARDAMPQGGEISIAIEKITGEKLRGRFPSATNPWYISLSVSDTGMGMDEAIRNQVFDPFFTTKEKGKGTGLGLSVVYGIVQAHHGFVNVESILERGTTFFLYFPVPQESSTALESHEQGVEQISGGNETLLFVEDETLLLDMVQILLESNGYTVFTAKDGEEAVQVYQQHSREIALVISDMGLPKLTGVSEFEQMKEINPAVKIIFASGYFEPDSKAKLVDAGVKGFLQKPYIIEEVLLKIRKALDTN
ncbi:MAG: PAS domain S-box protein [Bacteroidota bacterium]|jgi:PAS domain S-box-containing protein